MLASIRAFMAKVSDGDRGAGLVEYALLVALIALAVIIAMTALGVSIGDLFNGIGDTLDTAVA